MLDLMDNMLTHQLTETLYPAMAARLNYRLESAERGFIIRVDGFSEKLPVRCPRGGEGSDRGGGPELQVSGSPRIGDIS